MRARLPIIALSAAALLLAADHAPAAPRARADRNVRSSCLSMDIQFLQGSEEAAALLLVQWNCPRSELIADLLLDAEDGLEAQEAHIAGASSAVLRRSLGADPQPGLQVCAYASGEGLLRKRSVPVDQVHCERFFPEPQDQDTQIP